MINATIRQAKPPDWAVIQKLNHSIFAINLQFDPQTDPDWESTPDGVRYFQNLCNNPDIITYLAFVKNQPVGYLNGYLKQVTYHLPPDHQVAVIENLGILADFQRQGIATQLYEKFLGWCHDRQINHVRVESYFRNQPAINFYQKLDFKPTDITLAKSI